MRQIKLFRKRKDGVTRIRKNNEPP